MPVIRRRPDTADDSFTIHRRTSLGSNTTDTSAGNGSLSSTDDEAISNGTTDIRSTGNASTSDDGGSEVEWSNVLVGSEDSRSLISNDSGRSSFVDVPDGSVVDAESEDEDPYGNSGMGEGNLPFMIEGGWLDGMPDLTGAWNRDERMGDGCTPTATHGPFIRERLTPAQAAWTQEVFLVTSSSMPPHGQRERLAAVYSSICGHFTNLAAARGGEVKESDPNVWLSHELADAAWARELRHLHPPRWWRNEGKEIFVGYRQDKPPARLMIKPRC